MSGKHQTIQRGKGDNPPEATAEPPKKGKGKKPPKQQEEEGEKKTTAHPVEEEEHDSGPDVQIITQKKRTRSKSAKPAQSAPPAHTEPSREVIEIIESLKKQVNELTIENNELKEKVKKANENEDLQKQYDELIKENDKLKEIEKKKNEDLQKQYDELIKENDKLKEIEKKKNEDLQKQYDELIKENEKLKEVEKKALEKDELQKQYDEMIKENEQLKGKYEKAEKERDELNAYIDSEHNDVNRMMEVFNEIDELDEAERKNEDTFPYDVRLQEGKLLKHIDTKYHTAKYDKNAFKPELHLKQSKINTKQRVDLESLRKYKLK